MFVSRQLDAFAITRKNATAMLMLREYEEAHGDWLWQVDDQGRLVHLTDRMARMLDRDSDDLIGRHFVTLIAGGDDEAAMRPLALKKLADHFEDHKPIIVLDVPVANDDEQSWGAFSTQPEKDEAGQT